MVTSAGSVPSPRSNDTSGAAMRGGVVQPRREPCQRTHMPRLKWLRRLRDGGYTYRRRGHRRGPEPLCAAGGGTGCGRSPIWSDSRGGRALRIASAQTVRTPSALFRSQTIARNQTSVHRHDGVLVAATRRLPAGSGSGQTLIQVIGGTLSFAAAHPPWVWLSSGLRPVDHRDEEWLKRGLPSS